MPPKQTENKKTQAILKIRAKMLETMREWLNKQSYIEIQGPLLTPHLGEKTGFKVELKDKTFGLSGGLQPYTDAFLEIFNKIYTIAPTFRAEPKETNSHLIEFWRLEVNASEIDLQNIIKIQEDLISHTCLAILKELPAELEILGSTEKIKHKTPFLRLTYDEVIKKLQHLDVEVYWGSTLSNDLVTKLSQSYNEPFFITKFPVNSETFFYKSVPGKLELTLSADLIAPSGYGEISGGGETITEKSTVIAKMNELKISPKNQEWYLSLRRFNSTKQGGFALGIERFLMWICDLKNINETTLFPRTPKQEYP